MARDDICSVDESGRVTASAGAQIQDVCTVTLSASAAGLSPYEQEIALTLRHPGVVQLAGNYRSYCALFETGRVKCWGKNNKGQLGIGNTNQIGDDDGEMGVNLDYLDFGEGRTVVQISMGFEHACAILDNGKLRCWGEGDYGRLGYNNAIDKNSPRGNVSLGGDALQVATGKHHTCAVLVGGTLKCWGFGSHGRIGDRNAVNRPYPVTVTLGEAATAVTLGDDHSCALLASGGIKCWGRDNVGQLGDGGSNTDQNSPVAVALGNDDMGNPVTATAVVAGSYHTCAVVSTGLKCWGQDDGGQLGDGGSDTNQNSPVAVNLGSGKHALRIALGETHTCGILNDHSLKCWGDNSHGQLGIGSTANSGSPVAVNLGADLHARSVALGARNSCAVLNDGTVKCWGWHVNGSLGAGGSGTFSWGDAADEMEDNLARVPLHPSDLGTIAWGSFTDSSLVIGGTRATPTAPTLAEADVTIGYAVTNETSANCTLHNAETGQVSANEVDVTSPQECALTVTISKEGFTPLSHEISIPLEVGTRRGLGWNAGTTTFRPGDSPVTLEAVSGETTGITYTVTDSGSANCAFVSGRVLTFDSAGSCRVQATVTKAGYNDWASPVVEITVTAQEPVGIAWAGYSPDNIVEVGQSVDPLTATPDPSGAAVSYALEAIPSGACTINASGRLTAVAKGACYVTLTATDSSRAAGVRVVTVIASEALDFDTAGVPAYPDTTMGLEAGWDMDNLHLTDDNGVPVQWSFTAGGSRYGVERDDICSVDENGRVSASATAQLNDTCTVTVRGTAEGYITYGREFPLTLRWLGVVQLAGFYRSYCALFEGGRVKCWGSNYRGQLGIGNKSDIGDGNGEMGANLAYLNFGEGRTAVQISIGNNHACAVLDNGDIKCWGLGSTGQLGYGNTSDMTSPGGSVPLGGDALQVAVGGTNHTCAVLVGGSVKCWGSGQYGKIGDGNTTQRTRPVTVNLGEGAVAVAAGQHHSCALLASGGIKCWGWDGSGQLGDGGSNTDQNSPVAVNLGVDDGNNPITASSVSAGYDHTCAITSDGLKCWGDDTFGQRGDGGSRTNQGSPVGVNVGSTGSVLQIEAAYYHTCAVLDDHSLKCWGYNDSGQLGIGSTVDRGSPIAVNLGTSLNVRSVAAGLRNSCAALTDGTVKCWGEHQDGSLGAGAGSVTWGDAASEMGDNLARVALHAGDLGTIAWGSFADSSLVIGGSSATPTAPTLTEAGVTIGYALTEETGANCTLQDDTTGEVSANEVDVSSPLECTLIVTVSKTGFASQSHEISIPLEGRAWDLGAVTWGDFANGVNLVVGGGSVAPATTTHTGATVTYALTEESDDYCTLLDSTTGEVEAKAVNVTASSVCTLEITASKIGHTPERHQISIDLAKGTQQGVAWGPGVLNYQTGDASATLGEVRGANAEAVILYRVTSAGGTNCAFGSGSTLTFDSAGTCSVRALVRRLGYTDWTSPTFDIVISASDPVAIAWTGYSDSNVFAPGASASPLAPTLEPAGAAVSYSAVSVPAGVCSVHATDGTLTASNPGLCYVTLSATAASRAAGKVTLAVLVQGQLALTVAGEPAYPDTSLGNRGLAGH